MSGLTGKNPCLTIAFLSAATVTRHKNGLWHGRSLWKTICLDLGSNYMGWTWSTTCAPEGPTVHCHWTWSKG